MTVSFYEDGRMDAFEDAISALVALTEDMNRVCSHIYGKNMA